MPRSLANSPFWYASTVSESKFYLPVILKLLRKGSVTQRVQCRCNSPSDPPMCFPLMKTWGTVRLPTIPLSASWIFQPSSAEPKKVTIEKRENISRQSPNSNKEIRLQQKTISRLPFGCLTTTASLRSCKIQSIAKKHLLFDSQVEIKVHTSEIDLSLLIFLALFAGIQV